MQERFLTLYEEYRYAEMRLDALLDQDALLDRDVYDAFMTYHHHRQRYVDACKAFESSPLYGDFQRFMKQHEDRIVRRDDDEDNL